MRPKKEIIVSAAETSEEGTGLDALKMKKFEEEMNAWREEVAENLKHCKPINNFLFPMKRKNGKSFICGIFENDEIRAEGEWVEGMFHGKVYLEIKNISFRYIECRN